MLCSYLFHFNVPGSVNEGNIKYYIYNTSNDGIITIFGTILDLLFENEKLFIVNLKNKGNTSLI